MKEAHKLRSRLGLYSGVFYSFVKVNLFYELTGELFGQQK